jgi:predicted nucleotidyltransferase
LNKAEQIAGFPIIQVRNALRRIWIFDVRDIATSLNTTDKRAAEVIRELHTRGWCRDTGHQSNWELTDAGMQFINASATSPISRQRAETLLSTVIERATEFVEQYPAWPICLKRVAVFGSALSDAAVLGDLDIAIDIEKAAEPDFDSAMNEARERAEAEGFKPRSKFERIVLPELFLHRKLRGANHSISLHPWSDLTALNCPYRVVWSHPAGGGA